MKDDWGLTWKNAGSFLYFFLLYVTINKETFSLIRMTLYTVLP